MVRSQPGEIVFEILSQKYKIQKWADRVAQVVEHLPSKCEALNSNPIPPLPKNKKKSSNKMLGEKSNPTSFSSV
jgi:hypothetical protein